MDDKPPKTKPGVIIEGDVKDGNIIVGDGNKVQQSDFVARDKVIQNIQNVNFDIEKLSQP